MGTGRIAHPARPRAGAVPRRARTRPASGSTTRATSGWSSATGGQRRPGLRHERRRRAVSRRPAGPRLARRSSRAPVSWGSTRSRCPACAARRPECRLRRRDAGRAAHRSGPARGPVGQDLMGGSARHGRAAAPLDPPRRGRASMVGWAVLSLASLPPLDGPAARDEDARRAAHDRWRRSPSCSTPLPPGAASQLQRRAAAWSSLTMALSPAPCCWRRPCSRSPSVGTGI